MPISGPSLAGLDAAGMTRVALLAVKDWLAARAPIESGTSPDPNAATVSRLSAEQIRATLYAQLGLAQDDFFSPPSNYYFGTLTVSSLGEDNYPIFSSDEPATSFTTQPV